MHFRGVMLPLILLASASFGAPQRWRLAVTLHDEGLGMAGVAGEVLFHGPLHPGSRVGGELNLLETDRLRLYLAVNLAWASGAIDTLGGLTTNFGAALRLFGPVSLEAQLGAGAWLSLPTRPAFDARAKPAGGTWAVAPSLRAGLVVTMPWGLRPELVAGYEARLALALSADDVTLPRSSLYLGIRLPL